MKQAGQAMKQIHGGMSLEQVDETMYVISRIFFQYQMRRHLFPKTRDANSKSGTNSANNTNSARKSVRRLPAFRWANSPTRTNWMPSWKDWSRRLWTSVCSIRVLRLSVLNWIGYRPLETRNVRISLFPWLHSFRHNLTIFTVGKDKTKAAEEDDEEAELAKLRAEMAM